MKLWIETSTLIIVWLFLFFYNTGNKPTTVTLHYPSPMSYMAYQYLWSPRSLSHHHYGLYTSYEHRSPSKDSVTQIGFPGNKSTLWTRHQSKSAGLTGKTIVIRLFVTPKCFQVIYDLWRSITALTFCKSICDAPPEKLDCYRGVMLRDYSIPQRYSTCIERDGERSWERSCIFAYNLVQNM